MSAFQLVVIVAFLAIALGFSPSKTNFGRNVAVSKTQVYEVMHSSLALLIPLRTVTGFMFR
jgi:hypothetical protein